MGIFTSIMDKIFHHGQPTQAAAEPPAAPPPTPTSVASPTSPGPTAPAGDPPPQPVDVEAVLTEMAGEKDGGGNWQSSIVDLLKLLDLDSSLTARKQLAEELNVHVGEDGTAEENMALHKAVMQKLSENGGKVPDSLKG